MPSDLSGPIFPSSATEVSAEGEADIASGTESGSDSSGGSSGSSSGSGGFVTSEIATDETIGWTDGDWASARAGNNPNKNDNSDEYFVENEEHWAEEEISAEPILDGIPSDVSGEKSYLDQQAAFEQQETFVGSASEMAAPAEPQMAVEEQAYLDQQAAFEQQETFVGSAPEMAVPAEPQVAVEEQAYLDQQAAFDREKTIVRSAPETGASAEPLMAAEEQAYLDQQNAFDHQKTAADITPPFDASAERPPAEPLQLEPVAGFPPADPLSLEPVVEQPVAVEPPPADPIVEQPVAVEPQPIEPPPVDPVVEQPVAVEPPPVEPPPVEPIKIDETAVTTTAEPPLVEPPSVDSSQKAEYAAFHGFNKHRADYGNVGFHDYQNIAKDHLESPDDIKAGAGGRNAYWKDDLGSIFIDNAKKPDKCTMFKPKNGKDYFDDFV